MCSSMETGMSSGKSAGIHSGPYGAAVMTSFCWFSGHKDPSMKFMYLLLSKCGFGEEGSVRPVAHDGGALHLAMAGRVVHHGVVLRRAIVPDGHAARLPPPAHLVLGDERLADEVPQEVAGAGIHVLAEAHVGGRVVVR